ncbi:MAG: hypothetical protein FJ279_35295, partial [Planctomycetes bacterium]|nr:hypothetical protein [Planctomycetota bacterium]
MRKTHSVVSLLLAIGVACAQEAGVELDKLEALQIAETASDRESSAAQDLQKGIEDLYGLKLAIVKGNTASGKPGILLGRTLALASGQISEKELEAVKHDGYVIKASRNVIALAGFRPLGTLYAVHALLERLGLKRYPVGQELPAMEVCTPLAGRKLAAFSVASKPFFEYRSVMDHVDRGVFGASYLDLGDPQRGANPDVLGRNSHKTWLKGEWLGADHS